MSQRTRIVVAVGVIALIGAAILGLEALRGRLSSGSAAGPEPTVVPGAIPIYLDGKLIASFAPADLEKLTKVSFTDAAEGKLQDGWLLAGILRLHVADSLPETAQINVSSSSREKSFQLTWAEVTEPANMVMFDLSNRGTLKLVSVMPGLDDREEWVQDADRIEIVTKPQ
jgi:hypothetical protein